MADPRILANSRTAAAQRILATAARGITTIDTVGNATLSIGAGAANSTINPTATIAKGQGMYQANDASVIEFPMGKLADAANGYSTTGVQANAGIRFCTDSKNVDICIQSEDVIDPITFKYGVIAYTTNLRTNVRTRIQAADFVVNNAYGFAYVLITFADNNPRIIEWYMGSGCSMRGINVDPGYTIWKAPRSYDAKWGIVWDSFGQNALDAGPGTTLATNRVRMGTIDYIAEGLGVPTIFSASQGQTGFGSGTPNVNYLGRIQAGRIDVSAIGDLDGLIIPASLNDNPATYDSTLQNFVTQTFQLAMVKQPNAIIIGMGPQRTFDGTSGSNTPQSRYDIVRDGFAAAANGDPRMIYIDNSPQGEGWYAADARNKANFGVAGGTTPLHPNNIGKIYVGRRMASSIIAAVAARYGR